MNLPIQEATAKTVLPGQPPFYLIDGLVTTYYSSDTNPTTDPWIQLKLKKSETVSYVTIVNRVDCCGERLHGTMVFIGHNATSLKTDHTTDLSNHLCGTFKETGCIGEIVTINCKEPLKGKFVVLRKNDVYEVPMNMAEIQVHGSTTSKTNTDGK